MCMSPPSCIVHFLMFYFMFDASPIRHMNWMAKRYKRVPGDRLLEAGAAAMLMKKCGRSVADSLDQDEPVDASMLVSLVSVVNDAVHKHVMVPTVL